MESFPFFFKVRATTFTCIMLLSFLWLVLLSVEMFARWGVSDRISHSLMILFVLVNAITLMILPMLILVQFRIWLDAARLFLLVVLQVGSATAGTIWSPRIQCPDRTPDDFGVCQLIDVYTMMAFWVIPAILVFYSMYFAIVVYLQSRIPVVVELKLQRHHSGDPEIGFTDSLSLWREKLKEIVREQGPDATMGVPSRSLVLPSMVHARQSSLPQSFASQSQLTSPTAPRRQSTMPPSLPHSDQQPFPPCRSATSRHRSLPAFKHGAHGAHLPPLIVLSPSHPHASTSTSTSHLQTPSSHSHSIPSPANPHSLSFNAGPGVAGAQFPKVRSRHLSMIPMASSLGEVPSGDGNSNTRRARVRLSKPLPVHLM